MKSLIKRLVRSIGMDLRHYLPSTAAGAQLKAIFDHRQINLVFDIGANSGGYGRFLRECGYAGRIVSFEPLPFAHATLRSEASGDPLWEVAPAMAIGAEDGEIEINVSRNSVSSSILPMKEAHLRAAPDSAFISKVRVPIRKIDTLAAQYMRQGSLAFLKADTQGYEDRVLRGAANTLKILIGLQLELSFHQIYEQQTLFFEMIEKYIPKEFELWGIWPEFTNHQTGRLLAVDAIFIRS